MRPARTPAGLAFESFTPPKRWTWRTRRGGRKRDFTVRWNAFGAGTIAVASVPSALNLRVGVPLLLSSVYLEFDIRTAREHWQASLLMAGQLAGGTHSGSAEPEGSGLTEH